jgi:hypothetical protein
MKIFFQVTKQAYGTSCNQTNQCQDNTAGLQCINGLCGCSTSTQYWTSTICKSKETYSYTPCFSSNACNNNVNLYCISNKCLCNSTMYWSTTFLACLNLNTINQTCTTTSQCLYTQLGLTCISNKCSCTSSQYWSSACRKNSEFNFFSLELYPKIKSLKPQLIIIATTVHGAQHHQI